jgi:hypothetical protein
MFIDSFFPHAGRACHGAGLLPASLRHSPWAPVQPMPPTA